MSSKSVTFVRGIGISVPRQAQWILFFEKKIFFETPIVPIAIKARVIEAVIVIEKECTKARPIAISMNG